MRSVRAVSLAVVAAVVCGRLAATPPAYADVPEPVTTPIDLPVSFPPPMESPESASAVLPPPQADPQPAPPPSGGIAQELTEPELPTEGWTVSTHWKHKGDGTIGGEFYMGPQFKPTATGWATIDTALSTLTGGLVTSPGSLVPVTFGLDSGHVATFALPGGTVTESWTDATAVLLPSVSGTRVTYDDVAPGSDLLLDVNADGVKEQLVLANAQARRTWHFHLSDPAGALGTLVPLGEEAYRFSKPVAPDTYLTLPSPYAYELVPAGVTPPVAPGSAHQVVTAAGDGFDVTLSVDADWLADKSFPVVLDPSVAYRNTQIASWVTSQVSSGHESACGGTRGGCIGYVPPSTNPNAMGAATQTEKVGTVWNIDARPARSFYKFSTSQIAEDSLVTSAKMTLFQNGCFGFDATQYQCDKHNYRIQYYPLRQNHSVNSTWTQISATAATGPVLYYYDLPAFAPGTRTAIAFDIKALVDDWVVSGFFPANPNYGIGQRLSSEPATGNIGGPSFSGPNDPITDQRPKVDIVWSPPPGAPRNVVASTPTNTSVKVDWLAPAANGGPAVDGYEITLWNAVTGETTTKTCATCLTTTFSSVPYGSYYATVTASNSVGYGPPSANSNTVTLSPAPQLVKSVSPVAAAYGRGQELTFTLHVSNPASTSMVVDSITDAVPAGLVATGTPMTIDGAACTVCSFTGTTLNVGSFTVPGLGARDIVYKAVAAGVDRVCSTATNAARAVNSFGASTSAVTMTVCDTALGLEDWWSYAAEQVAAESLASVNVANGNLVVSANDSTPVQAHGRLSYGVRRTYNSQDTGVLALPGAGIGAGWQLNLGQVDDLGGLGIGATGLSVPSAQGVTSPLAVTLVDRDGTRHLFRFKSLATPISLSSLTSTSAIGTLLPKALDITKHTNVCVDGTYTAPAGVHLSLWRYVGVSSAGCGGVSTGVVLGFAAMRPDRLRTEYSWNGRLLSVVDPSGVELRYQYESLPLAGATLGRLTTVFEPTLRPVYNSSTTCAQSLVAACRKLSIAYPSSTEVRVTDPAGRVTSYQLDTATPQHLVKVVNPPETSGAVASDHVTYTYDGFGDNCDGSTTTSTGQLCSVTDARGYTSRFAYGPATLGPKRVTGITDRNGTVSTITYFASPDYVTADTGTHRTRYQGLDSAGRVGQIDEGSTSDVYLHSTQKTWDTAGCRQPATTGDNNVCRVTRSSFTASTPDEVTNFLYDDEGNLLAARRANTGGSPASLDTTFGFTAQYVKADGTTQTATDTPGAGGVVTSTARPDATQSLSVIYVITDQTASVTPRGNAAGASFANYRTTFAPANAVGTAPNTTAPGSACTARNTGVLCSKTEPFNGTTTALTDYTYDDYGQRVTMRTPQSTATTYWFSTYGRYVYQYYSDTERDLSGNTSAGGWLKTVSDPTSNPSDYQGVDHFIAYSYDRAGNIARTWDRRQTYGTATTWSSCCSGGYAESIRGSLSNPWRYVTEAADPIGNRTKTQVDRNGNSERVTPPRGVTANSTSYDVVATYDKNNNPLTTATPVSAAAGKQTSYTYDAFDNRTSKTDPNGSVTVSSYDAVNRVVSTSFTRGPFPTDPAQRPPGCRATATTTADAPLPAGRLVCSNLQSFDGVDNVVSKTDADAQVTTLRYDAVHRLVRTDAPRYDGVLTTLRTDTVYDADGNVLRTCPPRSFAEGGATTCAAGDPYATHTTYDEAGRARTTTTYRDASTPLTSSVSYDRDGNVTSSTDAKGTTTTSTYDLNNRLLTQSVPRETGVTNVTRYTYDSVGNVRSVLRPGAVDLGTGADGDLTIDGNVYGASNPYVMPTGKNFRNLTLVNGAYVVAVPYTSGGGRLDIKATGTVSVCYSCRINADGRGLPGAAGGTSLTVAAPDGQGQGPGHGGSPGAVNGGGGGGAGHRYSGSYGATATGGGAGGSGGAAYGSADLNAGNTTDLGSGGGGGGAGGTNPGGAGGAGGGFIHITANQLDNEGRISADGAAGTSITAGVGGSGGGSGGGGSGGGVWITAPNLSLGSVYATGGAGGSGPAAGGYGDSGYIRIDTDTPFYLDNPSYPGTRTLGRITAYSYDADNRVVDTVQASSSKFAESAGLTDAQGGRNIRTRVMYDSEGRVTAQFEPRAFATSTTTPDPRFMTRSDVDADGRVIRAWSPRYDASSASDPGLSTTQTSQCPTGATPDAVTGVPAYPGNVGVCVIRYAYDFVGNRTKVTLPTSNNADNRYVLTTYTDDNKPLTVNSPDPSQPTGTGRQVTATYQYDGSGRVVKTVDALGHQDVTTYTADGLVASKAGEPTSTATVNHFTEYRHDANGKPVELKTWLNHAPVDPQPATPIVRVSTASYYTDGLRKDVYGTGTSATDPARDHTTYAYDAVGNLTTTTSPSANAHDASNVNGVAVVNTYTLDNLLQTRTTPFTADGSVTRRTTYGYDNAGRKSSELSVMRNSSGTVTASSGTARFTYYDDDRMATQSGHNGQDSIAYTYDPAGHAVSVVNTPASGSPVTTTATFYLDGTPRTVSERGRTVQFAYDGSGARVARADVVDATGARVLTTNTYGNGGQLASLTSDVVAGGTQSWSYDVAGRLAGVSLPNGAALSRVYNPDDTVASQTLSGAASAVLSRWDYQYDGLGRVVAANQGTSTSPSLDCAQSPSLLPTGLQCFGYNPAGRLSQFKDRQGDRELTWDHDGNRLSYGPAADPARFTYNADDSIDTSRANAAAPVRHSTYSPSGALLGDECTTNTYDGFDRQLTATVKTVTGCGTPSTTAYTYDGFDRQTTRTESGAGATTPGTTTLYYDGASKTLAQETTPSGGAIDYALRPDGVATAVARTGSQPQYLTDDARGSVSTTLPTSSATVACSLRYDPFGSPIGGQSATNACSTGSTPTSLLFHGARRDATTGTYQMGSRTYDPARASFNTQDTVRTSAPDGKGSVGNDPLTRNVYSYVNGDPLNLVDPDGHRPGCDDGGDECAAMTYWLSMMGSDGAPHGRPLDGPIPDAKGSSEAHDAAVFLTALTIQASLPKGAQLCAAVPGFDRDIGILRGCRLKSLVPGKENNRNWGPRPDIVLLYNGHYYVWEVKPYNEYGRRTAERDAKRFVKEFQLRGQQASPGQWLPTSQLRVGKGTFYVVSPPSAAPSGARYYNYVDDERAKKYRESLVRKTPMPGEVQKPAEESPYMDFSQPKSEPWPNPSPQWMTTEPLPLSFAGAWWENPMMVTLVAVGVVVAVAAVAAVAVVAVEALAAAAATVVAIEEAAAVMAMAAAAYTAVENYALAA